MSADREMLSAVGIGYCKNVHGKTRRGQVKNEWVINRCDLK